VKQLALVVMVTAGFILIAAPTAVEKHQVFVNGKPLSQAVLINGVWAVPLADVARAAGMGASLEPAFELQGNSLRVKAGWDVKANVKTAAPSGQNTTSAGKTSMQDIHFTHAVDKSSPVLMMRASPAGGTISNNILRLNGQAYVPLTDLARAGGGVWTPGNLAPGAAIQLHFTNGILIGL